MAWETSLGFPGQRGRGMAWEASLGFRETAAPGKMESTAAIEACGSLPLAVDKSKITYFHIDFMNEQQATGDLIEERSG